MAGSRTGSRGREVVVVIFWVELHLGILLRHVGGVCSLVTADERLLFSGVSAVSSKSPFHANLKMCGGRVLGLKIPCSRHIRVQDRYVSSRTREMKMKPPKQFRDGKWAELLVKFRRR